MDPNLFHLDWERVFEALVASIVLAFLLERALSPFFENKLFLVYLDKPGVKEVIALAIAIVGCIVWQFDVISMIILSERVTLTGEIVTGAVIAGGSKASIKLFHDILNIKSSAYDRRHELVAAHAADQAQSTAQEAVRAKGLVDRSSATQKTKRLAKIAEEAAQRSGSPLANEAAAKAKAALNALQLPPGAVPLP